MGWPERMEAAIDYIEHNLDGEIDLSQAAQEAACSLFYFYHMFFAVFGITPGEYARQRRLTLAAVELSAGTTTVMEAALKYGYESPNAFTRAFRRLHGFNPGKAGQKGLKLSACPRISATWVTKGEHVMDYRIIERPGFDLVGKGVEFGIANGEFNKKGRGFWRKFVTTPEYRELATRGRGQFGAITGAPVLTAYLPNKNGTWDPVVNVTGIESRDDMDSSSYEIYSIPAAVYAEFNCTMKTSAATNKRIYSEWFTATGYERDDKVDIAAFFQMPWCPEIFVRWWIPVLKK